MKRKKMDFLKIKKGQYRENISESLHVVSLSEWLRSQTRNLMGFARTGSNPVADVIFSF